MKYFGIIAKNVAAVFQLQWKIGNICDMFLQYYVLCGYFTQKTPRNFSPNYNQLINNKKEKGLITSLFIGIIPFNESFNNFSPLWISINGLL